MFTVCRSPFSNQHTLGMRNSGHGKRSTVNGRRRLGQATSRKKKFFTGIVENPVEKIGENCIALQQSE
jgi:hypothetical protein